MYVSEVVFAAWQDYMSSTLRTFVTETEINLE